MEVMNRFASLVDENAEALAVLETLDMGKPIADVVNSTCRPSSRRSASWRSASTRWTAP
jgi:acyl-CoA reductase-like NAD-dependent aldehyde dehydrogenase